MLIWHLVAQILIGLTLLMGPVARLALAVYRRDPYKVSVKLDCPHNDSQSSLCLPPDDCSPPHSLPCCVKCSPLPTPAAAPPLRRSGPSMGALPKAG